MDTERPVRTAQSYRTENVAFWYKHWNRQKLLKYDNLWLVERTNIETVKSHKQSKYSDQLLTVSSFHPGVKPDVELHLIW